MNLSLEELLADLHAAQRECEKFEEKYQILSEDFFRLYMAGQIEDDPELHEWAGFYKAKRRCERLYEDYISESGLPVHRLVVGKATEAVPTNEGE